MTTALKTLLEAAADTDVAWEIEQAGDTQPDGLVSDEAKPVLSVSLYNAGIADAEEEGTNEESSKELELVMPSVVPGDFDIDYSYIFENPVSEEDPPESAVNLSVKIDRNGLEVEVTGSIEFTTKESECSECDGRGEVRGKGSYWHGGDAPDEDCNVCGGVGFYERQSAEVGLELVPAPKLNPKTGEWVHSKTHDYEWKVTEFKPRR
jgi:hypothetical protein